MSQPSKMEIDEENFKKRKSLREKCTWFRGMVERSTGNVILSITNDQDRQSMSHVMQSFLKCMIFDITIMSFFWDVDVIQVADQFIGDA